MEQQNNADAQTCAHRVAWEQRQREWARFHAWEQSCPEAWPKWDLAARIKWYASAWELARQFDPQWADGSIDWGKIRRIKRWREVITELGAQR